MAARTSFFFLQMVAVLSLLFTVSLASRVGILKAEETGPTCDTIYGHKAGDTCFSIIEGFKLTESMFAGINPNLDCDKLFVGQWLCISGTPN